MIFLTCLHLTAYEIKVWIWKDDTAGGTKHMQGKELEEPQQEIF